MYAILVDGERMSGPCYGTPEDALAEVGALMSNDPVIGEEIRVVCVGQTVACSRPAAVPESQRYDVFVSSRGVRFEYGVRRMRVVGAMTPEDRAEFVAHIRNRNEVKNYTPFPLTQKKPQVRVLGIRLG